MLSKPLNNAADTVAQTSTRLSDKINLLDI